MDVFGWSLEPASGANESSVHPQGAERPYLTVRSLLGAEQVVQHPVAVGDHVEGHLEVASVAGQSFGRSEGDHGDLRVIELVEVIAHGNHVFLAGQSSQVSVQDQYEWAPSKFGGVPGLTVVVDELDVGEGVTDSEGHGVLPD